MAKSKPERVCVKEKHWIAEDAEEMQAVIDEYFEKCKGELVYDSKGDPMTYKGELVRKDATVPSMIGLTIALGYLSERTINMRIRKSEEKGTEDDVVANILRRAKLRIEEHTVKASYTREGFQGSRLQLMNKYGYQDKKQNEVELTSGKSVTESDAIKALEALGFRKQGPKNYKQEIQKFVPDEPEPERKKRKAEAEKKEDK